MKRDLDLVRSIINQMGESESSRFRLSNIKHNVDESILHYHLELMEQGNLIKMLSSSISIEVIYSLTWDGHEFWENSKNETIWNDAKTKFKNTASGMSIAVLNGVLTELTKKMIGL